MTIGGGVDRLYRHDGSTCFSTTFPTSPSAVMVRAGGPPTHFSGPAPSRSRPPVPDSTRTYPRLPNPCLHSPIPPMRGRARIQVPIHGGGLRSRGCRLAAPRAAWLGHTARHYDRVPSALAIGAESAERHGGAEEMSSNLSVAWRQGPTKNRTWARQGCTTTSTRRGPAAPTPRASGRALHPMLRRHSARKRRGAPPSTRPRRQR